MKVLIFSAATGAGHNRAAEALGKHIRSDGRHQVETVDSLKAVSSSFDRVICGSYLFMARRAPELFGKLYRMTNRRTMVSALVPRINAQLSRHLLGEIKKHQPDVIVTTHPFATEMICALKRQNLTDASLVCVMTDYGLHRAWLGDEVDAYITACEDMTDAMVEAGVPQRKIHSYGIPVLPSFYANEPRDAFLAEIGFSSEEPVLLLMAGSFGVTKVINLYKEIIEAGSVSQIIVITGKNQKLYDAFAAEVKAGAGKARTHLVMFTPDVDKYMRASDLLLTKPGGLTTSEALASNLPIVAFDAIPGQEEDNANFLVAHNMGIRLHENDEVAQVISDLIQDKDMLADMQANCRAFDKSDCCAKMVSLMESLVQTEKEMNTHES